MLILWPLRNPQLLNNQTAKQLCIIGNSVPILLFNSAIILFKLGPLFLGNHGGVRLPVYREAVQDLQGPEVPLHADGVLPGRRALDHPQVHPAAIHPSIYNCSHPPIFSSILHNAQSQCTVPYTRVTSTRGCKIDHFNTGI